ncbi:hypothetical protein AYI96_13150 [Shewanella sp. MSW]|nr:hypothetical protein BFS86_04195 [Shewanella algae]TVP10242.1 hypothetical protein AYI96_13150 [Shewanella sp. MSW]BCV37558.1 hypothetical protein TUM17377_28860 [Shewanella chilikensis]
MLTLQLLVGLNWVMRYSELVADSEAVLFELAELTGIAYEKGEFAAFKAPNFCPVLTRLRRAQRKNGYLTIVEH